MPLPLKVLIVEDFPPDADLMVLRLKQEGYQPDWQRVETEADFLAALNGEYDLILSDWSLPQFSGRRALQLLNESKKDIPFILVSGSIGEETAVEMMREGADDYLLKDRPKRLGSAVSRALERYRDKKQRHRAEQSLAESEAELRALFASMRDVVLVIDFDGVYRKIAPTNQSLLVKPAEELLGKSLQNVFSEALAQEYLQVIHLVLKSGQTKTIEYQLDVQGRPVWFDGTISPMTPDSVIWVARDVTARKLAETQREVALGVLKKAQKVARMGNWIWHIQADRLVWSEEMFEIFGVDPETFTGKWADVVAQAIHPDDRAVIEKENELVVHEKKLAPQEYRVIWPDGSVHTIWEETGELTLDEAGNPLTLTGIAQDITERKRAEAEREAALDALKKAQKVAKVGSWTWHIPTNHLEWSDEMFVIFGINQNQFSGNLADAAASVIHPDDRMVYENANLSVLKDKKPISKEYRVIWPDGSVRTVWDEPGELTLDEAGNPFILNGIIQDITESVLDKENLKSALARVGALWSVSSLAESDPDRISDAILSTIVQMTRSELGLFGDLSEDESEMVFHTFSKGVTAAAKPSRTPIDKTGIWAEAVRQREPIIINAFADSKAAKKDLPVGHMVMTRLMVVPFLSGGNIRAVAAVANKPTDYNQDDITQITAFMNGIETIIEKKQAQEKLKRKSQLLEKTVSLSRALAATLNLDLIYRAAEQHLKAMIDCPNFGIELFDAQEGLLKVAYASSDGMPLSIHQFPAFKFDPAKATGGRMKALATKSVVIVRELAAQRKSASGILPGSDQEPKSAIYIPMLVEDRVVGILALQSYHADAYSQEEGEWLGVAANQIGLSIQNAGLFAQARQRLAELSALHSIDFAVTAHLDREKTLAVVLDLAMLQLGADAVDILLLNALSGELSYAMGLGFITQIVHHTSLTSGKSLAEKAVAEKRTIQILDLRKDGPEFFRSGDWAKESFAGYIGVPLIAEGKIIGVMEVFQRSVLAPDADWLRFLEMLAGQAAIAVDQIQLFEEITHANADLLQAYDATIEGWSQAMDLRDKETEGHTLRVTEMTLKLARAFGYREEEMVHIRRGALLHDIGKLGVPDHILFKPGPLTPEEWIIMRKHPLYAYQMLSSIEYLAPAVVIPYCHHEKWDGSGYPRGLAGESIPLAARIFAIVDVWDALSNDRPYRPAWAQNEVLAYLEEQSGTHFEPRVVDAFLHLPGLKELNV